VASERNPHFGSKTSSKSEGLSRVRFFGKDGIAVSAIFTSYGVRESAVYKLPSGVLGKAQQSAVKSLGTCWVLQVSSPAVLICKTV